MFSTVAALAAETAALLILGWMSRTGVSIQIADPWETGAVQLMGVLLLIAVTSGICSLVLVLVVYRLRQVPPPRAVTLGSCVIGILPILTVGWLS